MLYQDVRINRQIARWSVQKRPDDWTHSRARWVRFHIVRTLFHFQDWPVTFLLVLSVDEARPILRTSASQAEVVDQGGCMTFLRDSRFFFTEYHAGAVNISLHLVSCPFLFYGLTIKSVPLVLIGCSFSTSWACLQLLRCA